jgi:hypothetical protein
MTTSLVCVYEHHPDCALDDCSCECHSLLWAKDIVTTLDNITRLVEERFPIGVQYPPVLKALIFSTEALRYYSGENLDDPASLVQAELDLCNELSIGLNFIEGISRRLI